MKVGFIRIFWGLLLVVLDIRINSVDLIAPDFVGYILIVSGLTLLVPYNEWFRTARILAVIMIFVSLTTLVEIKIDSKQAPRLRREWLSVVTGDLHHLLPPQVASARLVHTTSSGDAIDTNRTHNPARDRDRVLGEYSDGTVVLILRYDSADEAFEAMKQKDETEYSFTGIRKRAETDPSFKATGMTAQHGSTGGEVRFSASSKVVAADREIQQVWTRGSNWWNPLSWRSPGLLYVIEGYRTSADTYKAAFHDKGGEDGVTFDALFPISILGDMLDTLLIWGICTGVIALSLSSNNYALMETAKRRRNLFVVLTGVEIVLTIMAFIAPDEIIRILSSGPLLLVVYAVLTIASAILIMGLMRKAAKTLPPPNQF